MKISALIVVGIALCVCTLVLMPAVAATRGNTLLVDNTLDRVFEVDADGNVVWEVNQSTTPELDSPTTADRLPNGNTLIAARMPHVIEVDGTGNIVWELNGTTLLESEEFSVTGMRFPDAHRLPDGNTLIAVDSTEPAEDAVIEVDSAGNIVWSVNHTTTPELYGTVYYTRVQRLPDGNTLIVLQNYKKVIEVDPSGNVIWEANDTMPGLIGDIWDERLPNGNTLICDANGDRVIEVDRDLNIIWEMNSTTIPGLCYPQDADRLPDGNTLIADYNDWNYPRVIEVDSAGNIVWEINDTTWSVWDWIMEVDRIQEPLPPLEFGDAPDPTHPSLLASDGARHTPTDTEFLGLQSTGDGKDFEPDAKIIDADLFDDGLLTLALTTGDPAQTVDFEVTNLIPDDQTLIVNILLDLNGDGDWNDPGEHVVQNQPIPLTGIAEGIFTSLSFSTVGATPGPTWMRITLTRHTINPNWDGTMASAGYAEAFECGETEDWLVELQEIVPPTPFLISGEVDYDTGEPVPDPAVTVLNTNTSESFDVNISGNAYQVTTDSTHVGAGNVLHFNASNGNVTEFNRTVIPDDMNAGGFVQNITIIQPVVPLPDLIVDSVSINPSCKHYYFANEPNVLDVTVKNIGTAAAGASSASVSGASGTSVAAVGALNPGQSETVTITDPVARPAGEVVTAIADCYGEVTESNEMNNTSSIIDPDGNNHVINHGFKGKWLAEGYAGPDTGNMTTWKSYELHGDLNYSVGDSYYISGYTPWEHYTANWTALDLPIPDGATDVVEARLYVYYTWDKACVMPDNVSTSFNGVNQDPYDVHYTDRRGYGSMGSYNLPYGALVYNVTDDFDTTGNHANVTKLIAPSNQVSMRGMMLVVVYEDPTEPLRQIFVIEEYDNLYAKASYCTTPEEATARALFTGPSIDMGTVVNANLITIAPGAGSHDGVYNPSEGDLIFNGQQLSDDAWDFLPGPTTGYGETELGACEHDVTALLQAAGNRVGMRSNDTESEWMEASNAFLVVEYGEPTGTCGDVDGMPGVTTNDGRQIFMYLLHGSEQYPLADEWAADCDGLCDGITTNDGRQIFMNLLHGSEQYPLVCCS